MITMAKTGPACDSTPVMRLVPPYFSNTNDTIALGKGQSFQFTLFVPRTAYVEIYKHFRCAPETTVLPEAGTDAFVSFATLRQCCTISLLNLSVPKGILLV